MSISGRELLDAAWTILGRRLLISVRRRDTVSTVELGCGGGLGASKGRVLEGRRVYGLDLVSGKKVWEYEAASPVTSSPALAKGKVVVATADGRVICFG